jgi:hypothetical protein
MCRARGRSCVTTKEAQRICYIKHKKEKKTRMGKIMKITQGNAHLQALVQAVPQYHRHNLCKT